jgi:hypothetical protein
MLCVFYSCTYVVLSLYCLCFIHMHVLCCAAFMLCVLYSSAYVLLFLVYAICASFMRLFFVVFRLYVLYVYVAVC